MKTFSSFIFFFIFFTGLFAQNEATIKETYINMDTYDFNDPAPVANPALSIYPYCRFDGFTNEKKIKKWKAVEMENKFIKVTIFPEIGGKIWGAVDKSTNREFIYYNHCVKFRDIAMRGPWVSGGIEFNFGIIGHAPTSSSPIDYYTEKKKNGSVSCYISSFCWITQTYWNIEINLTKNKAYFSTKTTWYNVSGISQPYYQWMNAGYGAKGDPEYIYPGTNYIGHNGKLYSFPIDENGIDLSWYKNSNFGSSKSYHILGKYNDYFGIYWHKYNFGSIHYANYSDKLGMKIFSWALSREGGIWEDLLTDNDGQYIELQSGRMYNQPVSSSMFTPFTHYGFSPMQTNVWEEFWFPIKNINKINAVSKLGALGVTVNNNMLNLKLFATQNIKDTVKIYCNNSLFKNIPISVKTQRIWKDSILLDSKILNPLIRVIIKNGELEYCNINNNLSRPLKIAEDFNWDSTQGLYHQGKQWLNQKKYIKAEEAFNLALSKNKYHIPTLNSLALLYYMQGNYGKAIDLLKKALSIDTYNGESNYLYGLANFASHNIIDALDGFSIASREQKYSSAALLGLAEIYLKNKNYKKAIFYAKQSLNTNKNNLLAHQILIIAYRKTGEIKKSTDIINKINAKLPLWHFCRFEKSLLNDDDKNNFLTKINCELPNEVILELGAWYKKIGCNKEALFLYSLAKDNPIALYQTAHIYLLMNDANRFNDFLNKANNISPKGIFPFRTSSLEALETAAKYSNNWKIPYYTALIKWHKNDIEQANLLIDKCNNVDFAPFYLTKALLKSGEEKEKCLLTAEKNNLSWRTGKALLDFYTDQLNWDEAVKIGKRYNKLFPNNYYIGLSYANALCRKGNNKLSLNVLKSILVLPNEGASMGRKIYKKNYLELAFKNLIDKKYDKAYEAIEKSKEWPENLGVGKPYDNRIDYRLENFILYLIDKSKNNQENKVLLKKIANGDIHESFISTDLLSAIAFVKLNKTNSANSIVNQWNKYNDNPIANKCVILFNKCINKANIDNQNKKEIEILWNNYLRDYDFTLIKKIMEFIDETKL